MKVPSASSQLLSAFAIDIEHELEQTGLFSRIVSKKTGDVSCALIVFCTLKNHSTTQAEVVAALEQLWNEAAIGYRDGENACKITTATNEVQMQFSTTDEEVRVTGRIEVVGFGS